MEGDKCYGKKKNKKRARLGIKKIGSYNFKYDGQRRPASLRR